MKKSVSSMALVAAFLLLPLAAQAQAFRTYLASYGNDANAGCSVAAPCRLLPAALNAVLDGGEVWILDSANYNSGTVNITKSVSILAVPGQIASIVAVGGTEAVNISTPGVKVALRNVVVAKNANNPGTNGIVMTNGASLIVEDSVFANLASNGIYVANVSANVHVKNSVFRNIGQYGLWLQAGPNGDVVNSQFLQTQGILIYATAGTTTTGNVTDSTISFGDKSFGEGVYSAASGAGAVSKAFVTRTTVHGTQWGLDCESLSGGAAFMTVSYTTSVGNGHGFYNAGCTLRSLGNNHISDNTDTVGALTPTALQ